MRQIRPHPLWIGHAGDCKDFRTLFDTGIEAVVQLAVDEPAIAMPREIISCRFPLVDSCGNRPELISLAIRTTAALIRLRIPTLLSCSLGLSRSPTIAAAALAMATAGSPDDCLKLIGSGQPSDVTPGLWKEVKEALTECFM